MDELAHRLHLPPSTANSIVDRLEERDLARRRQTSEDARVTELRLSAAARRLAFEVPEPPHSKLIRGVETLSRDDLDCVQRAMEILGRFLDVPAPAGQDPGQSNQSGE
jgi:DNA-binding MarR family transcriptional regulator